MFGFILSLNMIILTTKNGLITLEICSRNNAIYLTLYALMDSSIRFDTINLGWSIVYIEGLHFIISK